MRVLRLLLCLFAGGVCPLGAGESASPVVRIAVVREAPSFDDALRAVCEREYQGAVRVMPVHGHGWAAVNELDVEDYLLGVIGREMSPTSPLEALKAQAVAARTHALFQAISSRERPYDLVANLSQAYRGRTALYKNVVLAIEATRGEVLQYEGLLFPAFFHANCGGRTESAAAIWPISDPFGKGSALKMPGNASCPWCAHSGAAKWTYEIHAAALRKALRAEGISISGPLALRIAERSPNGRVLKVAVGVGKEEKRLSAERLRAILGWSVLKSALFTLERNRLPDGSAGERITFRGSGYGHGVGLCQRGAFGMAKQGADYRAILAHFFPKTRVGVAGLQVAGAP
ncbi:MAG: SpoIID/LytB domain-containing protein [Verrucomicrobiae bacterium]|nr:SpoIID/LytB domain-containing protein [Verrucomicrobiae bacterium]